jgi:hypothetical protein
MDYSEDFCFLNSKYDIVLQNFINLSVYDKPLKTKDLRILNHLLKNPDKNTAEIKYAGIEEWENYDYRTMLNHIKEICSKFKLIELVEDKVLLLKGTDTKYIKP